MDLVTISALNVDHLIRMEGDPQLWAHVFDICPEIRTGSETLVEEDVFFRLSESLRDRMGHPRLGGSGFNAVRAARAALPDFRIGMVGVIGNTPEAKRFCAWFGEHEIDTQFIAVSEDLAPGGCLSLQDGAERTLITTRGANDRIYATLRDNADAVIDWAAKAGAVHVSSFLDPDSPNLLTEVLNACRSRNSELTISIDPGAHWAAGYRQEPSIQALLDMSTLLFVNQDEFDLIFGPGDVSSTGCKARIAAGNGPPRARILMKLPDRLLLFDASGRVLHERIHRRLSPGEILESTGAGDALAGAYLMAKLNGEHSEHACLAAAQSIADLFLRHGWAAEGNFEDVFNSGLGARDQNINSK